VKRDGLECVRCHILGTEGIGDPHKEHAPTRLLLNRADDAQEKQGHGLLDWRTFPGAGANKVGECELVGVQHAQQPGQGAQGLVLAGADQECLDTMERVFGPILAEGSSQSPIRQRAYILRRHIGLHHVHWRDDIAALHRKIGYALAHFGAHIVG